MSKELIIDESNFSEYFKDVSLKYKPSKDEVIACYTTKAKFGPGDLKKDVINALENNAYSALAIIQKMAKARWIDSVKVLKEILHDRLSGMSVDEVENKEYEYIAEFFYYTKKEYIPKDDPHWSTLKTYNSEDLVDKEKNILIKSKIIENV
jgi:hypothetical protein